MYNKNIDIYMIDRNKKFRKLAILRVNKAINSLRLIGNLSNKNNYDYSYEESKKIIETLEKEVREVKAKFYHNAKSTNGDFNFD